MTSELRVEDMVVSHQNKKIKCRENCWNENNEMNSQFSSTEKSKVLIKLIF